MWFKSTHVCLLHHRFSSLLDCSCDHRARWSSPPTGSLVQFLQQLPDTVVLITAKSLKTVHTLSIIGLFPPFLDPLFLGFAFTTLSKFPLTLSRLTAKFNGQFSPFSYLSPLKHQTLFSSNHLLHVLSKNCPSHLTSLSFSASFTGSFTLETKREKKKKKNFLMLDPREA